jgi:hypothetical protein
MRRKTTSAITLTGVFMFCLGLELYTSKTVLDFTANSHESAVLDLTAIVVVD